MAELGQRACDSPDLSLHPLHWASPFTKSTEGMESSESGVIVLSASPRILHINNRARMLLKMFGESREFWTHLGPESLPSILTEFCRDLLLELKRRRDHGESVQFELRRICHMVSPPLLFRGFAVSPAADREPQVVLTLQACIPPSLSLLMD
ncbi:MAG TPA: hypothetical protein VJ746_07520 [Nitrospira sp.]|nr:hypothetical protein [Nitrospira sp.]